MPLLQAVPLLICLARLYPEASRRSERTVYTDPQAVELPRIAKLRGDIPAGDR
jgi:hypothetical protein